MKKTFTVLFAFLFLGAASQVLAHMPELIWKQSGEIQIQNPENSQAFYDELNGQPRNYLINFPAQGGPASGWNLYINLLVPEFSNPDGRYQANIFFEEKLLYTISSSTWTEYYEKYGRDYYLKGPEFEKTVPAGKYKIQVYSGDNSGKYVLVIGKKEVFPLPEAINIFWQIPALKMQFFETSVLEFFFTQFGIVASAAVLGLIFIVALFNFVIGFIAEKIRQRRAKTILLTSAGMAMKDEIIKLLQKPAYNIRVGFIKSPDYAGEDWQTMKEMGFNIEEVNMEGKKSNELFKILQLKDIIFVVGENLKYFKKNINKKVIIKLLRMGKVYIGGGAGSVVAGKQGMKLVPYDIFVHYTPEYAEIIKKKMPFKWQRRRLKILTDEQALFAQGGKTILIGRGEAIKI